MWAVQWVFHRCSWPSESCKSRSQIWRGEARETFEGLYPSSLNTLGSETSVKHVFTQTTLNYGCQPSWSRLDSMNSACSNSLYPYLAGLPSHPSRYKSKCGQRCLAVHVLVACAFWLHQAKRNEVSGVCWSHAGSDGSRVGQNHTYIRIHCINEK